MKTHSFRFPMILIFALLRTALARQLAFPGAEGYGRFTTGGRGGSVVEVTNLNDSGSGSLRAALSASGARTVVFRVSGTIALRSELKIKNGSLTIAGQTAPGDGICIRNYPLKIEADNVIIRYIRSRLGDELKGVDDAISTIGRKNLIVDHCSFSWGIDEAASFYDNENFTLQWCIVSESLYHSFHTKGDHGYGGIWGGLKATFHHNLLAHHSSRNPRFNGGRTSGHPELEIVDYRNNVVYNWGFNSSYGGESGSQNMIANYYRYGPATKYKNRIADPWCNSTYPTGKWYITDNFVFGYPVITQNNWNGGVQGNFWDRSKSDIPFPHARVVTHTAETAFEEVLEDAGANRPNRDSVDARIIREVRTGTAVYGGVYAGPKTGIIDSQKDVGGWPELKPLPAPADSDHDGMPDAWETSKGLAPADPTDRNGDLNGDGYTNLEDYLNSLCIRLDFITAPGGLRANPSLDRVHLKWQENAANETAFRIERSENRTIDYAEIGSSSANDTVFIDTSAKPHVKYYYRVRATHGAVFSIYSNIDSASAGGSSGIPIQPGWTPQTGTGAGIFPSWKRDRNCVR